MIKKPIIKKLRIKKLIIIKLIIKKAYNNEVLFLLSKAVLFLISFLQ